MYRLGSGCLVGRATTSGLLSITAVFDEAGGRSGGGQRAGWGVGDARAQPTQHRRTAPGRVAPRSRSTAGAGPLSGHRLSISASHCQAGTHRHEPRPGNSRLSLMLLLWPPRRLTWASGANTTGQSHTAWIVIEGGLQQRDRSGRSSHARPRRQQGFRGGGPRTDAPGCLEHTQAAVELSRMRWYCRGCTTMNERVRARVGHEWRSPRVWRARDETRRDDVS